MAVRTEHAVDERASGFLGINERGSKPWKRGLTEIRDPYYSPLDKRVKAWGTDVAAKIINALGLNGCLRLLPIQRSLLGTSRTRSSGSIYFLDHSQIVQLECLCSGIRGTASLRGRVMTCKG